MALATFAQLFQQLRERKGGRRVAVVAADEAHTLEAVALALAEGVVTPILIGNAAQIGGWLDAHGLSRQKVRVIDAAHPLEAAALAVGLVRAGEAEVLMKGRIDTAALMRTVLDRASGLRTEQIMSHLAVLEIPTYHKLLAVTDVALNLNPDLAQKRLILGNALAALAAMGLEQPKVAVMAAAEEVNPKLSESVDAAELKRLNREGAITGCTVEGPISYDLAIDREAVAIKRYHSPVAADTDLMLVPNLVAGNLMIKALMFSAGAKFAGIIVGAKVPIVVASRSSPAGDKHRSILLAAACSEMAHA